MTHQLVTVAPVCVFVCVCAQLCRHLSTPVKPPRWDVARPLFVQHGIRYCFKKILEAYQETIQRRRRIC